MAIEINIPSQNIVQTETEWGTDVTIYSDKYILWVSDDLYAGSDYMKSKKANGINTFADLDFNPLDNKIDKVIGSGLITDIDTARLADTSGTNTGDQDLSLYQLTSEKGSANGYASLGSDSLVPSNQLPSYVDDVLEFANLAAFPVTGESGKIYVALDTNKTYRWSGSTYIYITSGAVDSVNGQTGIVVIDTITPAQSSAIANNTLKVGYTDALVKTYSDANYLSIEGYNLIKTSLEWLSDTTVYSNKYILWVSDKNYLFTDQMKYKKADGIKTYANLDYMPNDEYYINSFKTRVDILGGTTEAEDTLRTQLEDLDVTPSLMITPNSVSDGKIYSIIGNSSATDGVFDRNTTATRVNSSGLIENVAIDMARIDYPTNGSCPHLLFEPQSTNLTLWSEDFSQSYWGKSNVTVSSDTTISPYGTLNADTILNGSGNMHLNKSFSSVIGNDYTWSLFIKKIDNADYNLKVFNSGYSQNLNVIFNIDSQSFTVSDGVTGGSSPIIEFTEMLNGWYKIELSFVSFDTTLHFRNYIGLVNGVAGKSIYYFGAQLEALPYATSYIPTNGSAVTRVRDLANNFGDVNTFNSEEGVLFVEMAALGNDGTNRYITLNDGSSNNEIRLYYFSSTNGIALVIRKGGSSIVSESNILTDVTVMNKFAVRWAEDDISLWANGVIVDTELSFPTFNPNTLSQLSFERGSGINQFKGKVKQVQVYKEALTDLELEYLTTYGSFTDLANANNYNLILDI